MRILALVLLCAVLAAPAYAGKNAGGALIVHTNDANNYTFNICARFETVDNPGSCESAGTQTDKGEDSPALVWLIASFVDGSLPGVSVIYFGLNHNLPPGEGYFANYGFCGPAGSIEVPDAGWPDQGGNAVAFGSPIVGDTFFPFYYLNAYGFAGAFLGTGINPTGGYAAFVDDSNPPVLDTIFRFGIVRWGTQGSNDCPCCPPPIGACCFCDYTCQDLTEADCLAQGGMFFGPGTDCATIECAPPTPGACCLGHECLIMSEWCCTLQNGEFEGVGTECDPNPCEPTPTQPTTWGRIKSSFK